MRKRRGKRWLSSRKKLQIRIFFFFLLILSGILLLDFKIRPIIEMVAGYQAKVFSTMTINNAVLKELSEENVSYENLILISTDGGGKITAMHADIGKLNRLKAQLTNTILEQVQNLQSQELSIQLGTLSGVQYLIGRGPSVPFRIVPMGAVETKILDKFLSAGVNQTQHQILMEVNISVMAVLPGHSIVTTVNSDIILAETILVGAVPDFVSSLT